jgi:hypothetical protein
MFVKFGGTVIWPKVFEPHATTSPASVGRGSGNVVGRVGIGSGKVVAKIPAENKYAMSAASAVRNREETGGAMRTASSGKQFLSSKYDDTTTQLLYYAKQKAASDPALERQTVRKLMAYKAS